MTFELDLTNNDFPRPHHHTKTLKLPLPPDINELALHSDPASSDKLATSNLQHDPDVFSDEPLQDSNDETLEGELGEPRRKRKRHKLYCFHCNRMENHFHSKSDKWYYSFLLGFSFGIASMIGPFRCVCCNHRRLSLLHHMHPRMILRRANGTQAAPIDSKPGED